MVQTRGCVELSIFDIATLMRKCHGASSLQIPQLCQIKMEVSPYPRGGSTHRLLRFRLRLRLRLHPSCRPMWCGGTSHADIPKADQCVSACNIG
ncbi:hypothetical protein OPV22_005218 [Ensete ventricosum]|uniref:Uncharacterized protein n=1 Tax=Ensete ventricosum TaxID=4639 RepID=A0AAV8RIK7_ENSVE|nr:hypothetical protein OPV22_005218 [Ensete ventricosum]